MNSISRNIALLHRYNCLWASIVSFLGHHCDCPTSSVVSWLLEHRQMSKINKFKQYRGSIGLLNRQ